MPLLSDQNRRKRNLIIIAAFLLLIGGATAFDLGIFAPELPVASNIVIFALFNLNLIVFLLLLLLLFRNLVKVWFERRQQVIGARFKAKLVLAFLLLSVTPAALIFVIASNFINKSIEGWFKPQVERPLDQALAVADGGALEIAVVRLRHRQRLIQRPLDLWLEPALDRLVDEVGGDDKDECGRRHRQHEKRQHELRSESCTDDLLLALEPHLGEVAEEQDEQQQEDDQVEVEEREDDDVRGHRQLGREHSQVERGRAADQHQEAGDDDDVALAAVLLAQQRHGYCTGTSVRYSDCRMVCSAVPAMRDTNEFSPFSAVSACTRT